MSTAGEEDSGEPAEVFKEQLYNVIASLNSSVVLTLIGFGVFLILLGATVLEGVWAGLFGIFGATAIVLAVGAFVVLFIMRNIGK